MPFKPGQSGNPSGKSKGLTSRQYELQKELLDLMSQHDADGKTQYRQFIDSVIKKAIAGNVQAAKVVSDWIGANDMITKLEAYENRGMARDLDFFEYRIWKRAHKTQKEILEDNAQTILILAGRRWGKTYVEQLMAARTLGLVNGSSVLYVSLTQSTAVSLMFDPVKQLMLELGFSDEKQDRTFGSITFSNGSTFLCKGNSSMEEIQKLRGTDYDLVIIDECQSQEKRLKYLVEDIIEPMLVKRSGKMVMSGTAPRVPRTYWERMWTKSPNAHRYHFTIADNPYIPNAETVLQEKLKEKGWTESNSTYQREWLGQIVYDYDAMIYRLKEKNYFTEEEVVNWIRHQYNLSDIRFTGGLDYGFEDYTSFNITMYSISNPEKFVVYEHKANRKDLTSLIDKMNAAKEWIMTSPLFKDIPNKYFTVWADPAGAGKLINAELRSSLKLDVRSAVKTDVNLGIEQLQEEVNKGWLKVKREAHFDLEAQQLVWKKDEDTESYLRIVDDDIFHPEIAMAVLYSLRQLMKYPVDYDAVKVERETTPEGNLSAAQQSANEVMRLRTSGVSLAGQYQTK